MRRYALLFLGLLLSACQPAPDGGLKLVTIDSPDAGLSLRELPPQTLKSIGLRYNRLLAQQGGRLGFLVRRGRTDFYVAVDLAGAAPPRDGTPKGLPSPRDTLLRT